jgi:hypothetical protein
VRGALRFRSERYSQDALNTFLKIELPAAQDAEPQPGEYQTIGQFYSAIADGNDRLCDPRRPRPNNLMGASPSANGPKGKQDGLPKSAHPPAGEDMDALLRGIRRYITPRELAERLHWHPETV